MSASSESILWFCVLVLENVAAKKYGRDFPFDPFAAKATFVAAVAGHAAPRAEALGHPVAEASERLAETVSGGEVETTLLVQATTLECFALSLYTELQRSEVLSEEGRRLAGEGGRISLAILEELDTRFAAAGLGEGEPLFASYAALNGDVFRDLNRLSDAVDDPFADAVGMDFDEVLAEISADLCDRCIALGMPRRELMSFVAGRFMTV